MQGQNYIRNAQSDAVLAARLTCHNPRLMEHINAGGGGTGHQRWWYPAA